MMQLPVMLTTERHGEFVADLHTKRSWLSEPQMVSIGGLSSTNQAGMRADKAQMGFVPMALGLRNR